MLKNFQNYKIQMIFFRVFLPWKMVASSKGKRASVWTNLCLLWQMDYICTVTYTVWMILVPKERACSKLHDGYQNSIQLFVLLSLRKELRANTVLTGNKWLPRKKGLTVHGPQLLIQSQLVTLPPGVSLPNSVLPGGKSKKDLHWTWSLRPDNITPDPWTGPLHYLGSGVGKKERSHCSIRQHKALHSRQQSEICPCWIA